MKEEIKLPLECDHASDDMGECCECYSTLEYWLEEAQLKLKELTALHAEVSGRNVTLHCKNLELEGKVKILTGGLEKIRASKHLEKPRCLCAYAGHHLCCVETAMETLTASEKWAGRCPGCDFTAERCKNAPKTGHVKCCPDCDHGAGRKE